MIIRKIEVKNFGKLSDRKINLESGVQILYGENENGKSTLMEFIKMMFYGNIGKTLNASVRERRIPWSGGKLGGSIEFEYRGKNYILQKEFDNKTPLKDKTLLFCTSDGINITLGKKEEVGERFFGIGLEDFEKSSYMSCFGEGNFSSGKNVKDIILNLLDTGDENVSRSLTEQRLDKAIKQLKWKNNAGGQIVELNKSIFDLKNLIYNREIKDKEQESIKHRIIEIDKLIKEKNNLKNKLRDLDLYNRLEKINKVICLMGKRDILKKQISNKNLSYDKAKIIIYKCEEQEKEIKLLKENIESLKSDLNNSIDYHITNEDINKLKLYIAKNDKLKNILDMRDTHIKEAKQLKETYSAYKETFKKVEDLNKELLYLKKYKDDYKNLKANLDELYTKRSYIDDELKNKQCEIEKNKENISLKEKSLKHKQSKNIKIFILISVIFAIIGAMFLVYNNFNFFYISLSVSILSIAYLIFSNIDIKNKTLYIINEKEKQQKDFINLIAPQKNIYDRISVIESKISELESYIKRVQEVEMSLFKLSSEIKLKRDYIKLNFKKLKSEIKIILDEFRSIEFNISEFFMSCSIDEQIEMIYKSLQKVKIKIDNYLTKVLSDKGCKAYEEYIEKYNLCLKNNGLIQLINSKKSILDDRKNNFIYNMKEFSNVDSYSDAVDKFHSFIDAIREEESISLNIKAFLKSLDIQNESISILEEMSLKIKNSISCNIDDLKILSDIDVNNMEDRVRQLDTMKLEERKDESRDKIEMFSESVSELKERLNNKIYELENKESYLKSLEMAKEVLNESYNELKDEISPRINKDASYIFKNLTDNKYNFLYVQDDCGILIKDGAFNRDYNIFSLGTIDQAYLSLRLALSSIIAENEPIPILIDDILARYDDNRLMLTLKYFKDYSKKDKVQIIIFTCHNYIVECSQELGIKTETLKF